MKKYIPIGIAVILLLTISFKSAGDMKNMDNEINDLKNHMGLLSDTLNQKQEENSILTKSLNNEKEAKLTLLESVENLRMN